MNVFMDVILIYNYVWYVLACFPMAFIQFLLILIPIILVFCLNFFLVYLNVTKSMHIIFFSDEIDAYLEETLRHFVLRLL